MWLSVVFSSNLADALKHAGLLPETWRFASGNLSLIARSLEIYVSPDPWAPLLFVGVLAAQLAAAALFWRAWVDPAAVSGRARPKTLQAFALGIGLFAAFLVSDELLIVYERAPGLETTHLLVLCALVLSLLLIDSLGERQ